MHHLPEKIRHSMVLYQPTASMSKKTASFHSEFALTLNFKASILKGSVGVSISHFISVVGDDGIIDVTLLVLRVTPFELAAKPLVPFRKPLL